MRSLPFLSDGLGVCVGRSALSTTELAEDPSRLSPPHAPTHIYVSPPSTLVAVWALVDTPAHTFYNFGHRLDNPGVSTEVAKGMFRGVRPGGVFEGRGAVR